ncbi:four helix bundle protein [Chryseobacterium sp. WG14]|nr:four helix bundle protein [Chryseobacterium sp. WG14]MCQ9639605.1 four helix bundle protein [Chryseobacterium sp. WG14]
MKSHRIEDLKVWSKSMALVKEVYLISAELPIEEKFGSTYDYKLSSSY